MTLESAAQFLLVSEEQLRSLVRSGNVVAVAFGRSLRFYEVDLVRAVRRHPVSLEPRQKLLSLTVEDVTGSG